MPAISLVLGVAAMAQPPEFQERFAREAQWHLQLTIESVEVEGHRAHVSGHVVRVFRGNQELLNSVLTIPVAVRSSGEILPPSGARMPMERLRVGRVLEAFGSGTSEELRALNVVCLVEDIDSATELPQIPNLLKATPPRGGSKWPTILALALILALVLALASSGKLL